jgi:hypothetical protein
MRILLDRGTPSGIVRSLGGHEVTEAIERGWDRISNRELLTNAEAAGFDLLLTTDKKIRYQQNLKGRKIAIVAWQFSVAHRADASQSNRTGCERRHAGQLLRGGNSIRIDLRPRCRDLVT